MSTQSKLQIFFGSYPARLYEKHEVLIQADSRPSAYYLTSGLVVQYDIAKNGNKLTLNTYKSGAFLPLASILNDVPSQFFFEAAEPTTAHCAPTADVALFLKNNPDITYDALARIARGGEGLMLRLAKAMEGSAEERILQELLIMKSRFFKDRAVINVTETDLATKTGMARETVSRTLRKLNAKGIISSRRGETTLSDKYYM